MGLTSIMRLHLSNLQQFAHLLNVKIPGIKYQLSINIIYLVFMYFPHLMFYELKDNLAKF